MLVRYHPTIGHLYVPNLVARLPNETGGYFIRTNSSGFRSDLEFDPAPHARPRILVFGDSFTAADGCRNSSRYAELVGTALDAEVYNFGLSGSAPDQHLLIYEHFGRRIEADLIIWGVSVHNIERIKLQHRLSFDRVTGRQILIPKPYFSLDGSELELRHVPVPRVRPGLEVAEESEYEEEGHIDPPLLQRLYFAPFLRGLRAHGKKVLPQARAHVRGLAYRMAGVQLYDDYLDEGSLGWRLIAATIKRFKKLAGSVPILIVPLPTYHYYVDRLEPVYQPRFDSLADPDNGLFVYGLTRDLVMGKSLAERQRICFDTDTHYSEHGHREIARLTTNEITRLGLLPKQPKGAAAASHSKTNDVALSYILAHSSGKTDSTAVLLEEGVPIAVGREEWFTRKAHQGGFPHGAANHCLEEARIHQTALVACLDVGVVGEERTGESESPDGAPRGWCTPAHEGGLKSAGASHALRGALQYSGPAYLASHGLAQCASAFYPSPFQAAAVLSIHGSVDGTVASIAVGSDRDLRVVAELRGSVGLDVVASRVAKLVGLSGDEALTELGLVVGSARDQDVQAVKETLLEVAADGSFAVPVFDEAVVRAALGLTDEAASATRRREVAGAFLSVVRECVVRMAEHARRVAEREELCVVGGAFLDTAAYEALRAQGGGLPLYRQAHSGPVSAVIGAAKLGWHVSLNAERQRGEELSTPVGPAFSSNEIEAFLDTHDFPHHVLDETTIPGVIAELLSDGQHVGYFTGRMSPSDPRNARAVLLKADAPTGEALTTAFGGQLRPVRRWAHEGPGDPLGLSKGEVSWIPLQLAGESVALTPFDAYRCMMLGSLDALLLERYLVHRKEQPPWPDGTPRVEAQSAD